ncbi:MAG: hypothetical protein EOP51_27710, partial [Sphingobacteriales bacterium]
MKWPLRLVIILLTNLLISVSASAQAPANDLCANAITLTSTATCTPVAGTVNNATYTTGVPSTCLGTQLYDVWYRFTAQSTNPVISLTGIGAGFLNPKVQVLGGICGTLTAVTNGCGLAATIETTPLNLVVGNSYFIRVFSTDAPIPTTDGGFNICVTDPVVPANDLCVNATPLTPASVYTPITNTVANATADAGAGCSGTVKYDVWYTFVAQSSNAIVSLTSPDVNFPTPRIQIFTGTCGALTQTFCNTAATAATTNHNFVAGTTYTIR